MSIDLVVRAAARCVECGAAMGQCENRDVCHALTVKKAEDAYLARFSNQLDLLAREFKKHPFPPCFDDADMLRELRLDLQRTRKERHRGERK